MSNLILPEPRTPLQSRAYALLRALEDRELSRPDLVALNGGKMADTKLALVFLHQDRKYVYICRYTEDGEPVYKIGCELDARRPRRGRRPAKPAPSPLTIPPPDPLVAALFARPATV